MSEENNNEANFNDSELQDIMAEIESLEQESLEEQDAEAVAEVSDEDPEVNLEASEVEFSEDELPADDIEPEHHEDNVAYIDQAPRQLSGGSGQVEFHGKGQMDFSMNFPIGNGHAELKVENGKVVLAFGDIYFAISEEECHAQMPGGASFSIPVSNSSAGKKAA